MEPMFAGIRVTHPERLLFPEVGLTKLDLVRYYDSVAAWMLPHLRGRPLTLKQCAPDADHCRYLRHSGERAPSQVRVIHIREKRPERWTINTVPRRLKDLTDPWAGYFKARQKLPS